MLVLPCFGLALISYVIVQAESFDGFVVADIIVFTIN